MLLALLGRHVSLFGASISSFPARFCVSQYPVEQSTFDIKFEATDPNVVD